MYPNKTTFHYSPHRQKGLYQEKIKTLKQLAKYRETDIEALHGNGNNALAALRQALTNNGLKFKK
ncbi:hypothetical protein EMGBS15_15770 [Filimonas sp.]|nr:hypothetical protein EMGBS15_15770 [Filimonas sp.]